MAPPLSKFRIRWVLIGAGLVWIRCGSVLLAAEPPPLPPGSSADVLGTKTSKEAQEKLLEDRKKASEKAGVEKEEPVPKEKQPTLFYVRKIHLLGGDPLLPSEETRPLLSAYEDKKTSFDELKVLCSKLEEKLRARGFVATVFVPPQRVENGEVRLEVVISRMGKLHLEGSRYFREWQTKSYWKIPEGRILRYPEIRSNVLDMNENPDRKVQAVLRPGAAPETTDIYLKEEDRLPIHMGFSADNQGVRLTGKERGGLTFQHNNLLGRDDVLYAGGVFGDVFGTVYVQHLLPLTNFGTRLITSFNYAQVNPKKEFEPFGINGISSSYGISVHQRLLRTDFYSAEGYVGFDFKDKFTRVLSAPNARDRLRVASAGVQFQAIDAGGVWNLKQDLSFGIPFHDEETALTSRQAGSAFSKYEFEVSRLQRLSDTAKVFLKIHGQLSPDKMTSQEDIFLGGFNSVRGYPESDYGADEAVVVNLEHRAQAPWIPENWRLPWYKTPLRQQTEWVSFVDYGHGRLNDPSATEHVSRNLLGAGAGFNVQLEENFSMRFAWGFPIGPGGITEGGRSQFYWRTQRDF